MNRNSLEEFQELQQKANAAQKFNVIDFAYQEEWGFFVDEIRNKNIKVKEARIASSESEGFYAIKAVPKTSNGYYGWIANKPGLHYFNGSGNTMDHSYIPKPLPPEYKLHSHMNLLKSQFPSPRQKRHTSNRDIKIPPLRLNR